MTLYSISVCQKPWRITTLKLSLGVTKLQASLERLEEYLEGQLSQRRLQVEYLEGLQQLPVPLVVFLVVDQSPLQLTMLVSLVELNRHQQVPKETEVSRTKIFVRNPDDPWVPRDTANDIPKIEWICDL